MAFFAHFPDLLNIMQNQILTVMFLSSCCSWCQPDVRVLTIENTQFDLMTIWSSYKNCTSHLNENEMNSRRIILNAPYGHPNSNDDGGMFSPLASSSDSGYSSNIFGGEPSPPMFDGIVKSRRPDDWGEFLVKKTMCFEIWPGFLSLQ